MIFGFILLGIGLLIGLWFLINMAKDVLDKPMVFNKPIFVTVGTILWIGLSLSGLILIFLKSITVGLIIVGLLFLLLVWLKKRGTPEVTKKTMLKSYQMLRTKHPDLPEKEILFLTLKSRYRDWDNERLKMYTEKCKNIEELTNVVLYREFGLEAFLSKNKKEEK